MFVLSIKIYPRLQFDSHQVSASRIFCRSSKLWRCACHGQSTSIQSSNPLISYRTPSVKVSQGLGVASDAFSNLRHLSFASITPWCKQKENRQEIENKDVNYQITKADYKVEENSLLICKGVILGFSKTPHRVVHASNGPSITSWSLPRKSVVTCSIQRDWYGKTGVSQKFSKFGLKSKTKRINMNGSLSFQGIFRGPGVYKSILWHKDRAGFWIF